MKKKSCISRPAQPSGSPTITPVRRLQGKNSVHHGLFQVLHKHKHQERNHYWYQYLWVRRGKSTGRCTDSLHVIPSSIQAQSLSAGRLVLESWSGHLFWAILRIWGSVGTPFCNFKRFLLLFLHLCASGWLIILPVQEWVTFYTPSLTTVLLMLNLLFLSVHCYSCPGATGHNWGQWELGWWVAHRCFCSDSVPNREMCLNCQLLVSPTLSFAPSPGKLTIWGPPPQADGNTGCGPHTDHATTKVLPMQLGHSNEFPRHPDGHLAWGSFFSSPSDYCCPLLAAPTVLHGGVKDTSKHTSAHFSSLRFGQFPPQFPDTRRHLELVFGQGDGGHRGCGGAFPSP